MPERQDRRQDRRLSRQDWIDAGLRALAREGAGTLKADVLAKRLGVSRGSFYWHFQDLAAYHQAVIARWREIATQAVIAEIERFDAPVDRLHALLARAFAGGAALEFAMRAWAASDPRAARGIAAVDRQRLVYLEKLLTAAGVGRARAVRRAQLLYWAFLGFVSHRQKSANLDLLLDELRLLAMPEKT